jgi:hypothetical protein
MPRIGSRLSMQARMLGEKQQDASCHIAVDTGILEAELEAALEAVSDGGLEAVLGSTIDRPLPLRTGPPGARYGAVPKATIAPQAIASA